MSAKDELELRGMLLSTGLVQPVRGDTKGGRVSVLCRLAPGQEPAWLKAIESLLKASDGADFSVHCCKQFVLKDGVMVAGWSVAIEAKGHSFLKSALDSLRATFEQLRPELVSEAAVTPRTVVTEPVPDEDLEEEEELETQQMTQDLVERRKAYMAKTTATPRPRSTPTGPVEVMDPEKYKVRVVQRTTAVDSKGRVRPVIIEEMPIPGVYAEDMNKPNEKDRGAKTLG